MDGPLKKEATRLSPSIPAHEVERAISNSWLKGGSSFDSPHTMLFNWVQKLGPPFHLWTKVPYCFIYHMPDTVAFSLCLSYQQKFNDIYWLLVFLTSNRMTGILSLLVLVSFFFQNNTVRATRTLIVTETRDQLLALAPSSDAGICKLLVESRGYVCEEHTVNMHNSFFLDYIRLSLVLDD